MLATAYFVAGFFVEGIGLAAVFATLGRVSPSCGMLKAGTSNVGASSLGSSFLGVSAFGTTEGAIEGGDCFRVELGEGDD